MNSEDFMWIVFMLKDRYSTEFEKNSIINMLVEKIGILREDIRYIRKDENYAMSFYLFVRERNENDMTKVFDICGNYLDPSFHVSKFTNSEFVSLYDRIVLDTMAEVKYGDIVKIRRGKFEKLWGIVLRESKNGTEVDVGLKFCFGKMVRKFGKDDLIVDGNIFKFIKILN